MVRLGLRLDDQPPQVVPEPRMWDRQVADLAALREDREPLSVVVEVLELDAGLPRGYLVYARDSGVEPRLHTVRNSGQQIVVATLDVTEDPDHLLAQVDELAMAVASDSSPAMTHAA
jgi:hypothetical protein